MLGRKAWMKDVELIIGSLKLWSFGFGRKPSKEVN
jgi:hypothetical protein